MSNEDCTVGVELKQRVIAEEGRSIQNERDHAKLWDDIDKLRNRLPIWATGVMSLLSFTCGVLGTLLAVAARGGP